MTEDRNREQLRILLRKRKSLSADSKICSGCRTCEVVCSLSHEGAVDPERSRIRLRSNSFKGSFIPVICHQCADPACRAACPESAIEIEDAAGIVFIRDERCTGCRSCEKACPFDAMGFDPDRKKAFKCDMCRGDPACVAWCPMNALGVTEFGGAICA